LAYKNAKTRFNLGEFLHFGSLKLPLEYNILFKGYLF